MIERIKALLEHKEYTLNRLSKEAGLDSKSIKKMIKGLPGVRIKRVAGTTYYSLEKKEAVKKDNQAIIFLKKNYLLASLILFSSFLLFFNVFKNNTVWWDEAEYLVFAKNAATGSNLSGFWEGRAILYPLMLAFFSLISSSEAFLRVVNLIFAFGSVIFAYLSFKRLFNDRTAFFAALLLSANWIFQFYAVRFLTDIPALMFQMISLYFFAGRGKKSKIFSGLFLGLATITRFTSIFLAPAYLIVNLMFGDKRKDYYWLVGLLIGFVPSVLYDVVSGDLPFSNLYSFFMQNVVAESSGTSMLAGDWIYYIINSPLFLNPVLAILLIVSLFYLILESFKGITKVKLLVLVYFFICFFMFSFVSALKELRFIMQVYAFMYLLIALLFEKAASLFSDERGKMIAYLVFGLIIFYSMASSIMSLNNLMDAKKDLGITVKSAGEYIQTVTSVGDVILANYPPVSSYYSNRAVMGFGEDLNKTLGLMVENDAVYVLLTKQDTIPSFFSTISKDFVVEKKFSSGVQAETWVLRRVNS